MGPKSAYLLALLDVDIYTMGIALRKKTETIWDYEIIIKDEQVDSLATVLHLEM